MEERADTSQTAGSDDRCLSSGTPRSLCRRPVSRRRVIEELDGNGEAGGYDGDATTRQYTWGLDLAAQAGAVNSLEQAGGIGGLLAAHDTAGTTTTADDRTFLYFYDANGNVGQVVETTTGAAGTIVAHYEYTPYGQCLNAPAAGEYDQPYRYSTKPFDSWTGLGYWGYRWYSPNMGRWVNRDPIGEPGGLNLYMYVFNTTARLDAKGAEMYDGAQQTACCEFTDTIMYGGALKKAKTVRCHRQGTPGDCCNCAGLRTERWQGHRRTFDRAYWGECCCCTMYRARLAPFTWPKHQSLFLICPDRSVKVDFVYKEEIWGITFGQKVDVYTKFSNNPEATPGDWIVQHKLRISCDTAAKIQAQAEADVKNPPDYNAYQDCHWYARKLFGMGVAGVRCE